MGAESLGRAMRGSLTYQAHETSDWDKLTALAMGSARPSPLDEDQAAKARYSARESLMNSLGVSLLGLRVANRFDLLRRASDDLSECLRWRVNKSRHARLKVSILAIREWLHDNCDTCYGSGHRYDEYGVVRVCTMCGGSKKKRYTDGERAKALEVEDGGKWANAMQTAHGQISFALAFAVRGAMERLR